MLIYRQLLIFLLSFAGFVFFLTPNINTGDGGELVTTSHYLGVAHPSGYPLYLLIAKMFIFLPFGNMAFKVTLMSAMASALILTLMYLLVERLTSCKWSALFTVTLLFQAYAFFTQSVIAKFYPLNLLLILLISIIWILHLNYFSEDSKTIRENSESSNRNVYLSAFILGIALANHHTALLIAGPLALVVCIEELTFYRRHFGAGGKCQIADEEKTENIILRRRLSGYARIIGASLLLLLSGFLINAYLLIRGGKNVFFNPSPIKDLDTLYAVLTRQAYGESGSITAASNAISGLDVYLDSLKHFISAMAMNFSIFSFVPFVIGCLYLFRKNLASFLFTFISLLLYGPFIISLTLGSSDISEIMYYMVLNQYFLPALVFFTLFAGIGFYQIRLWLERFNLPFLAKTLAVMLAFFPLVFLVQRAVDSNYRTNHVPYQYTKDTYTILPVNSMLITFGDNANYQGWYLKSAGRYREDICQITSAKQDTSLWTFQGCPKTVYGNIFSMLYSSKDFKRLIPIMLKDRFYGTQYIKQGSIYAAYMTSFPFSIAHMYLPKNLPIANTDLFNELTKSSLDNRQLKADKLINNSVCLSHMTDDLFTRQLCTGYLIHLANIASHFSNANDHKIGEIMELVIMDAQTGEPSVKMKIPVTENNIPYLELANQISEFNKWKIFYLRKKD